MPRNRTLGKIDSTGAHEGILRNIIIVNFFYRIFSESFRTLIVPYSEDKLMLSDFEYGLMLSAGQYAAMGIIFFLGYIVDIQFKKITMIIGLICTVLAAVLFTRVEGVFGLTIFFYCLYFIGQSLMMLSTNTFVANETKKGESRTTGFSYIMFFRGLAATIAPITCTYLLLLLNYEWVFTIMGSFGLIALVLVFTLRLIVEDTPKDEIKYAEKLSESSGDDFHIVQEMTKGKRSILGVQISFGLGRGLMGFASGVAIPFVGLYIYDVFNLTEIQWGWLNTINWMFLTIGYIYMGSIAEIVGKEIIVVIYWILVIPAAFGIMLASYANLFYFTAFFFILRYLLAMTPSAAWNSFIYEWIPPKHRGKTMGLIQTGQRGLRATGTLVGGTIIGLLGALTFPVAMFAYPLAGLLPLFVSLGVKKKLNKNLLKITPKKTYDDEKISENNKEYQVDDTIKIK
ncbi:MAG: MFS transporter [Asgard group archaeon]|nr:MFS transporter [Asgard group archaeon]